MQSYNNYNRRSPKGRTFSAPEGRMPKQPPPANMVKPGAPIHSNMNSPFAPRPRPKPRRFPMLALKGVARFVPYIGWAYLAWEFLNYWEMFRARSLNNGWIHVAHNSCTFQQGGVVAYNGFCSGSIPTPTVPDCGTLSSWNNNTNPSCTLTYEVVQTLTEHNNPLNDRKLWLDYYYRPKAFNVDLLTSKIEPQPFADWAPNQLPDYPQQPQMEPHKSAPNSPMPYPQHVPYSVVPYLAPNPWASPTEQSSRGYYVYPTSDPDFDPIYPQMYPMPRANEVPLEYPPVVYDVGADGAVRAVTLSGRAGKYHERTPPERNEKEKKAKKHSITAKITRIALMSTEFNDLLKAIEKSMDKKYKPDKKANLYERLKNVYDHADSIDPEKALFNLVDNLIEDAMIGNANRGITANGSSQQWELSHRMMLMK